MGRQIKRSHIDRAKLHEVVVTSDELNRYTRDKARALVRLARAHFNSKQVATNEWRTSETTPPKYVRSFSIAKVARARRGYAWEARNNDPAATWVEYGAHAGGKTLVLRYYPFTTAIKTLGAFS